MTGTQLASSTSEVGQSMARMKISGSRSSGKSRQTQLSPMKFLGAPSLGIKSIGQSCSAAVMKCIVFFIFQSGSQKFLNQKLIFIIDFCLFHKKKKLKN